MTAIFLNGRRFAGGFASVDHARAYMRGPGITYQDEAKKEIVPVDVPRFTPVMRRVILDGYRNNGVAYGKPNTVAALLMKGLAIPVGGSEMELTADGLAWGKIFDEMEDALYA